MNSDTHKWRNAKDIQEQTNTKIVEKKVQTLRTKSNDQGH